MNKFRFEDLNVYRDALLLVDSVYNLTSLFPKDEMFGLTNQLRRASVSIVLNIAEGSSRTKKDFSHFLSLSRGSCFECVAILTISFNRNLISKKQLDFHYEWCNKLAKMISKLKSSLA
jgi:four helix bundle protein